MTKKKILKIKRKPTRNEEIIRVLSQDLSDVKFKLQNEVYARTEAERRAEERMTAGQKTLRELDATKRKLELIVEEVHSIRKEVEGIPPDLSCATMLQRHLGAIGGRVLTVLSLVDQWKPRTMAMGIDNARNDRADAMAYMMVDKIRK